jgi:RNA binding exosome subunit
MRINIVVQATEDGEKLLDRISRSLGLGDVRLSTEIQELTGHYGNPIDYVEIELPKQRSKEVLRRVIQGFNERDMRYLMENLDRHRDEKGKLYLRLDKQELCLGKFALSEMDSVRIVNKISEEELHSFLE